MLKFNDNDIFKMMNDFESVAKAGFIINKRVVTDYGVGKEVELTGTDPKGNEFSFKYAQRENVELSVKSLLSIGSKGFFIDNKQSNLFIEEDEKTYEQKLDDTYNAIKNKKIEGIEKILKKEEIEELINLEKPKKVKFDFRKMAVRYKEIAIKYEFDVNKIRSFIFNFIEEMENFKPSKSYIFNSVFEKMKNK